MKKIKILIAEDSPLARDLLTHVLSDYDDLTIAGYAENGREACEQVRELKPDLVLMDIHMPVMNGIEATEVIMAETPTPIIVVTTDDARETAFQAITAGALEVVLKPTIEHGPASLPHKIFVENIRQLSQVEKHKLPRARRPEHRKVRAKQAAQNYSIIGIASSTGGPRALQALLPQIEHIDVPIVIVQHLNADFADQFISWIQKSIKKKIVFAQDDDELSAGRILVAPPGIHIRIGPQERVQLFDGPKVNFQIPSADHLLESIAQHYKDKALGLILTGMGRDGASGMLAINKAGGHTIAQDEESSVIFGMPGAAIREKAVQTVASLDKIPEKILTII